MGPWLQPIWALALLCGPCVASCAPNTVRPASLQIVEEPDPTAGPGQVVVAVEAAGVNYADALTVAGTYQIKIPLPFTPGMEMAGTIVDVGDGVEGFGVRRPRPRR